MKEVKKGTRTGCNSIERLQQVMRLSLIIKGRDEAELENPPEEADVTENGDGEKKIKCKLVGLKEGTWRHPPNRLSSPPSSDLLQLALSN